MKIDGPTGWHRPETKRTLAQLHERIAELRAELTGLELEAYNREHGPRLEAIAKIRNLMRAHQITIDEVVIAVCPSIPLNR